MGVIPMSNPVRGVRLATPRRRGTTAIWRVFELSLASGNAVNAMDERIETFLADVLALEGEDENAIRQGVRLALADCEQIFKGQEVHRRVKARPPTRHAAPAWSRKSGDGREHQPQTLKASAERYRRADSR